MPGQKRSGLQVLKRVWRILLVSALLVSALSLYSVWRTLEIPMTRPELDHARERNEWRLPSVHGSGRVLLLMIDGLSVGAYERAMATGRLPNLQKIIGERPTVVLTAVSTFPSATSPSVQELLSGQYAETDYLASPGAVHAFDRDSRHIIRYVTMPDSWQWPVPTLFDVVGDRPVITVFEGRWDGPTTILTQYNMASQAILASLGASALSNGDAGPVQTYVDVLRSGELPAVSLVVLNEFDVAAHFFGPDSEQALEALRGCDDRLGEILNAMAATPASSGNTLLDETSILVFGDHGHSHSGTFVDLLKILKTAGIKAVDVSTVPHVIFRERLGTLWTEWPDAILVAGGSNVTQVYLRHASGSWSDSKPATDGETRRHAKPLPLHRMIDIVTAVDGIDQVFWRNGDDLVHMTAAGIPASIAVRRKRERMEFAYVVDESLDRDPLGYLGHSASQSLVCRHRPVADACYFDAQAWMDATIDSKYPGAVPMLPKAFRPARFAGDLILTAKPGYSFLHNQSGDHGNLHRDSMLTPLILNGPGVTGGSESHVPKLADIYPTASVLLGADPDDPAFTGLDGRVLDAVREP